MFGHIAERDQGLAGYLHKNRRKNRGVNPTDCGSQDRHGRGFPLIAWFAAFGRHNARPKFAQLDCLPEPGPAKLGVYGGCAWSDRFCEDADVGLPGLIRPVGPKRPKPAALRLCQPNTHGIVQLRAVRAHFRANIWPGEFRANTGRVPIDDIDRPRQMRMPANVTQRQHAKQEQRRLCARGPGIVF